MPTRGQARLCIKAIPTMFKMKPRPMMESQQRSLSQTAARSRREQQVLSPLMLMNPRAPKRISLLILLQTRVLVTGALMEHRMVAAYRAQVWMAAGLALQETREAGSQGGRLCLECLVEVGRQTEASKRQ